MVKKEKTKYICIGYKNVRTEVKFLLTFYKKYDIIYM